ncbi:rna-directed dna polymerase from mobile element jockey- hypothetical protein [Limosa lapponica baueri]|uniref:Reverse transcriptase domain-containing protein n=1 Tax=Limosa lapponica baueri TaxID=1758121 RepID=A0A2I0UGQ9_LIMLA|nr:rna-directed dna polymerase from mobile element jockey- hypothetical protein [Limosa lapponica baueri]
MEEGGLLQNSQYYLSPCKDYGEVLTGAIFRKKVVTGNNQHRFTKDKLCLANPIALYNRMTDFVDKWRAAHAICLNFSSAFDMVSHNTPRDKLGIHGPWGNFKMSERLA